MNVLEKVQLILNRLMYPLRRFYLRLMGAKIGENLKIESRFIIKNYSKLTIGDNCYINNNLWLNAKGRVCIGNNVLVGPSVTFHSSNHNFERPEILIKDQGHTDKPVYIGDNVWIGASAIVLPGVSITSNVIVSAGSVVTKNIESSGVYAGVPAVKIKELH